MADIHRIHLALDRRVFPRIIDHLLDEADRLGGAAAERPGADRVDADVPFAASFVRERTRITLQSRLGAAHAAAITRHRAVRRHVAQADHRATLVHHRAKMLDQGNQRIGRGTGRRQITATAGLEQGVLHFRTIGQRMHQNVDLAVFCPDRLGDFGNGEIATAGITLVGAHLERNLGLGVKCGVQRKDLRDLHFRPVRKDHAVVKLAAFQ